MRKKSQQFLVISHLNKKNFICFLTMHKLYSHIKYIRVKTNIGATKYNIRKCYLIRTLYTFYN